MKITLLFFSLLILSCSNTKVVSEKIITNNKKGIKTELTFEETQDSLRTLLLNSKPNENLKSSILQELYIRGLVNQKNDKLSLNFLSIYTDLIAEHLIVIRQT